MPTSPAERATPGVGGPAAAGAAGAGAAVSETGKPDSLIGHQRTALPATAAEAARDVCGRQPLRFNGSPTRLTDGAERAIRLRVADKRLPAMRAEGAHSQKKTGSGWGPEPEGG